MGDKIILCYDMDMYYAAVMIRDNPELKGKPLVIGAKPHERGVVATSSYEARAFGIHSGMSSYEAYLKCPQAIFLHPKMSSVLETSEKIKTIVQDYSDVIEFVALDEAYIELTNTYKLFHKGDINKIALELQRRIYEATRCTCTIGLGYSKYSAKLAGELHKPNGFGKIMERKELLAIISNESIRIIYGIGEQMEKRLNSFGIHKVKDIQVKTIEYMKEYFGVYGVFLHYMSHGIDDREVLPEFEEVGIGNSKTLDKNISGIREVKKAIAAPIKMACYRLKSYNKYAKNVMVKLRYSDFTTITRAKQLKNPVNTPLEVYREVCRILEEKVSDYNNIRLIGVRLSSLTDVKCVQLNIFQNTDIWDRTNKLYNLSYELRQKYGYDIIRDTIGTEFNELQGEKNDSRRFDALGNCRTLKCFESLYR